MEIRNLAENTEDFTGNVWLFEEDNEKTLFDVGTGDCWENIRKLDSLDRVVITHSHRDHVENLERVVEKYNPKIYAYNPENLNHEAEKLKHRENFEISSHSFEVIHTPGHKDDSICLYNAGNGILFTGDLIFPEGSFGRTDLEEGDREKLIESIKKISKLEVDSFYPGHDSSVTEEADKWIEKSLKNAEKREAKY